ncbi:MAG: sigma-70 family RNA polymerase sigma factor [bacterium]|nr:sigma-70 family RNA polymerase sigma factor [bacterium]
MTKEPPEDSDAEIIAAVLKGDKEQFGEIVKRYQGRLVNFLYRLLYDQAEAHDLAQEVFFKTFQALDRYDSRYKFSTWLFRVGQNAAIDRLRKRRLKLVSMDRPSKNQDTDSTWEFPSEERGPYGELRNQERGDAITEAIKALPWEYRELIVMRHYGELSYAEIAELKELPLGTVKNKLFRARQILKESLADYLVD